MGSLGEVLKVMVACGEQWPSVHAELVYRHDPAVARAARRAQLRALGVERPQSGFERASPPGTTEFFPDGEQPAAPRLRRGRLLAAAGLVRVEWPDEDEVTVVTDEQWRARTGGQTSAIGTTGPSPAYSAFPRRPDVVTRQLVLVRPWLLVSWLRLRVVGGAQVGGRPATRVEGRPRSRLRPPQLDGLADGAQRVDLVVDDETGVVVEFAAFYEGRVIERLALRHLTVGDIPDPSLFDLAALDGAPAGASPVRPTAPAPALTGQGPGQALRPLAELAAEVDFRLFIPAGRPYVGRVERRPGGVVVVAFAPGVGGELLTVSQSSGVGIADTSGWERIVLPDGTQACWWPPEGELVQGHLVFDRAGTHVWVRGVDRAAMVALALALRPCH